MITKTIKVLFLSKRLHGLEHLRGINDKLTHWFYSKELISTDQRTLLKNNKTKQKQATNTKWFNIYLVAFYLGTNTICGL